MKKAVAILGTIVFFLCVQCVLQARAEGTSEPKERLTVYGPINDAVALKYLEAHPGIAIERLSYMDAHQLLNRAVAHDEEPDIYCFFSLDTPFYRAMRERGYLAELQGESARRLADAVCEGIQTECYDADHVLRAIPVSAIIGERLAANTSLWERLNLGAYPQTWDQMFDFIENWCRNSEMNSQYALMGYTSAEETRNMIGYILRADYDTYRQSFEEPLKYSTEIYQRLLHRLQTLPLDDLEYDVEYEYDHILLSDLYLPSPVGGGFTDPSMSCLQLSVDGTVPTPALAVVYYLCVNPSSENLERAMELVNFFAENIPLENRATLCPDFDTPIASDELEQRKAEYDEQLEALAIRYGETNDRAEQTALQLEMEQLSRDFQYYIQNNAYLVDQNSLERYHRDIQNGLVVDYGEGVLDADTLGKLSDKHEMFIAGMLTVEQYTEVLDQIVYMQEQEWKSSI